MPDRKEIIMTNENNNLNPQETPMDPGVPTDISGNPQTPADPPPVENMHSESPAADFAPQIPPQTKPKKNLPLLIGAVVIVAALIAFIAPKLMGSQIAKDPIGHVMLAAMNTSKEKAFSSTVIMDGRIDESSPEALAELEMMTGDTAALAKYINALAGNFRLRADSNTIYSEDKLFASDFDARLQYADKNFIRFQGSMSPWKFVFQSDDLYSKPLYLDLGQLAEQEAGFNLNDIDIPGYIAILTEKDELSKKVEGNAKAYEEPIREFLKDKIEPLPKGHKITVYEGGKESLIDGYGYKFNGGIEEIYELYAVILEKAKTDENVKALILDRMNKIVDKAVADKDYEKFGATEEEFTSTTKEMINELDTNYESKLDEAIAQLRDTSSQFEALMGSQGEVSYDIILSIDKQHRLRQYEVTYRMNPIIMKQTITYNAFGGDVKPNIIEASSDAVDLYALANQPQPPTEMIEEIADNLMEKVLSGEAMDALLQDAQDKKDLLPEDERDAIANGIGQAVDNMKGSIGFMKMMFTGTGTP